MGSRVMGERLGLVGEGRKREVVVLLVVLKGEGRWRVVGWPGVGRGGWL